MIDHVDHRNDQNCCDQSVQSDRIALVDRHTDRLIDVKPWDGGMLGVHSRTAMVMQRMRVVESASDLVQLRGVDAVRNVVTWAWQAVEHRRVKVKGTRLDACVVMVGYYCDSGRYDNPSLASKATSAMGMAWSGLRMMMMESMG